MLLVRVYVNLDEIDTIGILNTGHVNKKTKEHLYRICYPKKYQMMYNHIEIYHKRSDSWSVLVEKVLKVINNEKPKEVYEFYEEMLSNSNSLSD